MCHSTREFPYKGFRYRVYVAEVIDQPVVEYKVP